MGYLANQEPSPQDTVRRVAQGGSLGQGNCAPQLCQPSTGGRGCHPEVGLVEPVSGQRGSWGLEAWGRSPRTGILNEYLGELGWVGCP